MMTVAQSGEVAPARETLRRMPRKPPVLKHVVSIRIDDDTAARIDSVAKPFGKLANRNDVVRRAVELGLAALEANPKLMTK